MQIKISESNGTFKVTIASLVGQEVALCRESSGSITVELCQLEAVAAVAIKEEATAIMQEDIDAIDSFELERVPMFKVQEAATVAAPTQEEITANEMVINHAMLEAELQAARRQERAAKDAEAKKAHNLMLKVAKQAEARAKAQAKEENDAFIRNDARDNALFQKLSWVRRETASAQNVPPYMIFHDKTLRLMVEKMPVNLSELGNISGVGKAKLEKYGTQFLSALQEGA